MCKVCGSAYVFRFNGITWVEEQRLVTLDHVEGDGLGESVSVNGNVAVLGASRSDCSHEVQGCGAAYAYRFDGLRWGLEKTLTASSRSAGAGFGRSVAVDVDVAVVAAANSVYVYRFNGSDWIEEQQLTPSGASVAINGGVIGVAASSAVNAYRYNGQDWVLEQRLVSTGGGSLSVAGDKAVVGASGIGLVFEFNGSSWVETQRLTASDAGGAFGSSVAISGDLVIVGARLDDCSSGPDCGSAYAYLIGPDCNANGEADFCDLRDGVSRDINESGVPDECEPEVPTQCELEKLTAPDAASYDQFGISVSVDADVALVGANGADELAGASSGAAHLFRLDGSKWSSVQTLAASDAAPYAQFGVSVSVHGDVAVVGASEADCDLAESCGAAYIYRFNGSTWVEEQRLRASDGRAYDRFGNSVAAFGDVALVGAFWNDCAKGDDCGAAYAFRFDGATWIEEQKLVTSDTTAGDFFGYSVSVSKDVAVVGATLHDCPAGDWCGAAYVFRFNGSTWVEEQKLAASDAAASDQLGVSVSVDGDVAVVGAWLSDCMAGSDCGAAYVYRFNGPAWVQEQKLTASDAAADDGLGRSVAVNGNRAVVGAYRAGCPNGGNCGAAYVYRFNGSAWVEDRKLTAPAGAPLDYFGFSVAVTDGLAIVGAYGDDAPPDSGSVFAFTLGTDCNGNDRVDVCDIRDGRSLDVNNDGVPDECTLIASLDIKPGACPNPFNPKSQGVLPVAVLGSPTFDVTQIDTTSLALKRADGGGGSVRPLSGPPGPGIHFEDVATPFSGLECGCNELGADGIKDLTLKFSTLELVASLELGSLPAGASVALTVTGVMRDGAPFEASDCIVLSGAAVSHLPVEGENGPSAVPSSASHHSPAEPVPIPVRRTDPKD
jgi:hypothetical protein